MRTRRILIVIIAALSLLACGEAVDTLPGQPIAHRRAAFKKLLLAFEPLGIQLRDKQFDPAQFNTQLRAFVSLKDAPWPYFGADTKVPPTHAKASIWDDPDRFRSSQDAFQNAVARLVNAADAHDEERVRTAYDAVQKTCRDCHKAFRE